MAKILFSLGCILVFNFFPLGLKTAIIFFLSTNHLSLLDEILNLVKKIHSKKMLIMSCFILLSKKDIHFLGSLGKSSSVDWCQKVIKEDITMPVSRCDLYDPITNSNIIKDHLVWKNCEKMNKIEAWNRCGKWLWETINIPHKEK